MSSWPAPTGAGQANGQEANSQSQNGPDSDGDDAGSEGKAKGFTLLDVVREVKPTVLIGVSGQGGAFTEPVVREMSRHCARPTVLPLSNPSRLAEARPEDINVWSDGRALIATGSPFPAVPRVHVAGAGAADGGSARYTVAESNNALGFPGLAGGVILAQSPRLSDTMIVAGVDAIAGLSPALLGDPGDALLPDLTDVRNVSMKVAAAVALAARREGLARAELPDSLEEIEGLARRRAWEPLYRELRPGGSEGEGEEEEEEVVVEKKEKAERTPGWEEVAGREPGLAQRAQGARQW